MKSFIKKTYKDVITVVIMLLIMSALVFMFLDMDKFTLGAPLSYDGGDGMSYIVNAVMLMEGNTTMESDRMGAPYGYQGYDFYASSMHNFDNWILKVIVQFTDNPAVAANLMFLMLFPLITLFGYFVLRQMNIRPWISAGGALTYAFMPYLFLRGMNHYVLASYYFVPVSILLCMWVYTDDNFFAFNKGFFKQWKNYFAVIMCVCIANNGISYYPFFTCFFLIITGIVKALREKKVSYFGKALVNIVMIVFWVVMALIPNINYIRTYGANKDAFIRTVDAVETYALKIAQLFIPANSHGIEVLDKIISTYEENMPLVNENYMAYLGVMGCFGFIALLVVLFLRYIREDSRLTQQLSILSVLNIGAVLLGTVGGFGSLFGLLITDLIRCYNRISIFIAFIDIAAVCILIEMLSKKIFDSIRIKNAAKWIVYIAYTAFIALLILGGIYFQFPGEQFDYETFQEYYESDEKFVQQIENTLPEGSMIFQLPYHEYPEGGSVNDMGDYDLWAGFIHSKDLRWSYGGVLGREADMWLASINYDSVPDIVKAAKSKGFAGIYIDRRAYDEENLKVLEDALQEELGGYKIVSDNDMLSFFYIK